MSLNIVHTLERMEIPMSVTGAIQAVREIVGETDTCVKASKLIRSLLSLEVSFSDSDVARVTSLAVAEAIAKVEGVIADEAVLYAQAVERAERHMKSPRNAWMYVKPTEEVNAVTTQIEGTEVSVEIRADGKIKRGGKQTVAADLFRIHVLESETPCDNACFVAVLMEKAGMSKAGARTYAHNLRKANGMVA